MSVGEGIYWCLADAAPDRPLGHVQVFRLDQPAFAGSAELGYWLLPAARGLGVMGRAVDLVRRFAFGGPAEVGWACTAWPQAPTPTTLRRTGCCGGPASGRSPGSARSWHTRVSPTDGLLWELLRDGPVRSAPTIEGRRVRLRGWRLGTAPGWSRVLRPGDRAVARRAPAPVRTERRPGFLSNALETTARGHTVHWALADPPTTRPSAR